MEEKRHLLKQMTSELWRKITSFRGLYFIILCVPRDKGIENGFSKLNCQEQETGGQCGQIGPFFKRLGDKVSYKISPNVRQLYYEHF